MCAPLTRQFHTLYSAMWTVGWKGIALRSPDLTRPIVDFELNAANSLFSTLCFQLSSVLSDLLVSIVLATILSLVVEMPFIRLFNYATTRSGSKYDRLVLKFLYVKYRWRYLYVFPFYNKLHTNLRKVNL